MDGETLNFVVTVPKKTIEDLALNLEGLESIEGTSSRHLAELLRGALAAGLEEYLGEVDDISVMPT